MLGPVQRKKSSKHVHSKIHKGWEYDDDDDVEYTHHKISGKEEWEKRLLIDSQSTVNIFKDDPFLKNVHTVSKPCKIKYNAGFILVYERGFFINPSVVSLKRSGIHEVKS